ncbi:MAG TPA: hypothetical protein VNC39_00345 [Acidocella sp.]|jgi:hypothetical protein|uniref:hypothetical protein n=1 Tax=Acidocella sp. TaxID=50710 RepID=UPI002BFC8A05|nr:hypothetical protein [Acidocella sp.]HVE20400.1 hypothetical protein [Acidocella sp.]
MPRKIYKPEEIIAKLRQVEILTSQSKPTIDVTAMPQYHLASLQIEQQFIKRIVCTVMR